MLRALAFVQFCLIEKIKFVIFHSVTSNAQSFKMDGMGKEVVPQGVTQNEYKELKRVFEFLANFAPKQKLRRELEPRAERRAKIQSFKAHMDSMKMVDETGQEVPLRVIDEELRRIEHDIHGLQRRIESLDAIPQSDKKIHCRDLQLALAFLGKQADKARAGALTSFHSARRLRWRWQKRGCCCGPQRHTVYALRRFYCIAARSGGDAVGGRREPGR